MPWRRRAHGVYDLGNGYRAYEAVNSGRRGGNIKVWNLEHVNARGNALVFESLSQAREYATQNPHGFRPGD